MNNPIPLITEFFQSAKWQRECPKPLTDDDYQCIIIVLNARLHQDFNGQSISNLLLGIAYHGTQWQELQERQLAALLLDAVSLHAYQLKPQEVANTLWALMKMGARWIDFFSKEQLSNAELLENRWYLVEGLLGAIAGNIGSFCPQEIAIILWALAKSDVSWSYLEDNQVAGLLLYAIAHNVKHFQSREITHTLWGLATMGMQWCNLSEEKELVNRLFDAVSRNIQYFNAHQVAITLWSLITIGVDWNHLQSRQLAIPLLSSIDKNASQFKNQAIANTLWALAVTGIPLDDFPAGLMDKLVEAIGRNSNQFLIQDAYQIVWSAAWFRISLPWFVWNSLKFFIDQKARPISSQFHKDISELLSQNQLTGFQDEYCIQGIMYVDICFPDIQLVVEIDGPFHIPLKNQFKDKLLESWGYTVIRVSYQDCLEEKVTDIKQWYHQKISQKNAGSNISCNKRKRDDESDLPPWKRHSPRAR